MPFTPFHFGHALPFGFLDWKKNRIDLPSALLASVIVDVRATYIFIFNINAPYHGILHNFLIATLLGMAVAIFMQLLQPIYNPWLEKIDLKQESNLMGKIIISVCMTSTHIFLDAALYPEMNPLWPFHMGNPLLGWLTSNQAYLICIIGFIVAGIQVLGYYFYRMLRREPSSPERVQNQRKYQVKLENLAKKSK
ncbi:MAG: hypothetical protein DRO88_01780 [Promethearchaeia archaeon]|nr:MAG: hypothetical protein DRO88_01780 [Candidatus Lokiarchaeia archaeon]